MALTANTLDHCPNCDPKPAEPEFSRTGRWLELGYFILINTLLVLGVVFLIQLLLKAWLSR